MSSFRYKEPTLARPTYRHILSAAAQTASNPLRVVAHCDIDAAYAQFEAVRLGSPDDVPLIVVQWETIIAVNYPARKYGIKRCTSMGPKEARELCPHVVIVHTATYRPGETESGYWEDANVLTHKVSLDPYRRESAKVISIFQEMVPNGVVEKASIDEAYMNLTPLIIERLIAKYPFLAEVPKDAPDGIDSLLPPAPPIDWADAGYVIPISDNDSDSGEPEEKLEHDFEHGEGDEDRGEGSSRTTCWSDWALRIGADIMTELREEIWKRLHYTTSAGVAHNKAMAKLCSSVRKPRGQTILRHSAVAGFLRDTPFTDIRNLGGKLGRALADEFQMETVGELLRVPLTKMQSRFGEESIWIYNLIRGIDETEVQSRSKNKTMLASKNLIPPCTTPKDGLNWIDLLAGELNVRLLEARELSPGLWPKTLVLSWRTGYGYGNNVRSRQAPFGFTKDSTPGHIEALAKRLWREACTEIQRGSRGMDVHNLSLQFSGVERMEDGQRNITSFLGKRERDAAVVAAGESEKKPDFADPNPNVDSEDSWSWTCSTCGHRLDTANPMYELHLQEHQDYHFALELSRSPNVRPSESAVMPGLEPKVEGKRRKKDIRAFFQPR